MVYSRSDKYSTNGYPISGGPTATSNESGTVHDVIFCPFSTHWSKMKPISGRHACREEDGKRQLVTNEFRAILSSLFCVQACKKFCIYYQHRVKCGLAALAALARAAQLLTNTDRCNTGILHLCICRARICKPFKEPRNLLSALAGRYDNPIC